MIMIYHVVIIGLTIVAGLVMCLSGFQWYDVISDRSCVDLCMCVDFVLFFLYFLALRVEMHDEIFHFEVFKNFMKILKYFKTLFWNISWNF